MHRFAILSLAILGLLASTAFSQDKDALSAAQSANGFAQGLFKEVRKEEGNLFFSPYSIHTALSMCYGGAKGDTAAEMAKAMRIDGPASRFHKAMEALQTSLNGRTLKGRWRDDPDAGKQAFELVVANALWAQKAYPFERPFLSLAKDRYDAGAEGMDFKSDAENCRLRINKWVEDKTNDRIKDLIAKGLVGPDTRLVLTNALYFKAAWAEPFRKFGTKDKPFHVDGGEPVEVPTMHRTDHYQTLEKDSYRVLAVPYAGRELSMIIVLPRAVDGLDAVESDLDFSVFEELRTSKKSARLLLGLPRFTYESSFQLNAALKAMGMRKAFAYPDADFTGMSPTRELYIGVVVHKAFVDVNEKGTEAAAATAVVMRAGGVPKPPEPFQVDRPFLFVIQDNKTGAILFVGRVTDPRG